MTILLGLEERGGGYICEHKVMEWNTPKTHHGCSYAFAFYVCMVSLEHS